MTLGYESTSTPMGVAAALSEQYGLTGLSPFVGGETGAQFYTCQGPDGSARVLKIAASDDSAHEITDNIHGYMALREIGAAALLPDGIESGERDGTPFLLMPHLGEDFATSASAGNTRIYKTFLDSMMSLTGATLRGDRPAHVQGLVEFKSQVTRWYDVLLQKGWIAPEDMTKLASTDMDALASDRASLMILDFTPNNVFVDDHSTKFIDPWRQGTYIGSIIPSISQFATLARLKDMPGMQDHEEAFRTCIDNLGAQLGLSTEQIRKQELLGQCLQYALSGFVRTDSDPLRAKIYIENSKRAMRAIAE